MQKNKLNLHISGIHLLNPYKTVVSHLKPKGETNGSFSVLHHPSGVHSVKTVGSQLRGCLHDNGTTFITGRDEKLHRVYIKPYLLGCEPYSAVKLMKF